MCVAWNFGAISEGETEKEALTNIKDAILTIIDMMKEQGEPLPTESAEVREFIVDSKAKVDRIFSVNQQLVRMKIGRVRVEVHDRITRMLS